MIELRDVTFTWPGAPAPAVQHVSLTLAPGETVALLGANGSGKSTLAKLFDGLLLPGSGSVTVDGMDTCDPALAWDVRARVGLVLQDPDDQLVGTVVEEEVAFGPENLGVPVDELRRRVEESLAAVGLKGMERREPHLLSQGQKQRLAIAGALAMRPAYLVLDEPVAMLDESGRRDVLGVVRRLVHDEGRGVIHISHRLADIADADRAVVLSEGRVVFEGTPRALFADPEIMRAAGLAPPPLSVLVAALRARGVDVEATAATPEEVVAALWR